MMLKTSEISKMDGKEVTVRGWVYRQRSMGDNVFIVLRDSSGVAQCVVKKGAVDEKTYKEAANLYIESSIIITGTVKKDERAPGGAEIKASKLEVVSRGEFYPIQKDLSEEYLLDVRHLWLRSRKMVAIMQARHYIMNYLREWLNSDGFFEITPPILTKAGAEGGAEMFELDYFGDTASLTQSSQLYGEAMIFGLEKVYTFAPSFRAEKSRTKRHLTEFWHLEPEMAWMDQKQNEEIQEKMISYVVQKMVESHKPLLEAAGQNIETLKKVKPPFNRIFYDDAVDKINELGGKMGHDQDPGADEEALLLTIYDKPVFVKNYPLKIKAFYMKEDPKRPGTALNADLLAPGVGEIIGGSEREWDFKTLEKRMKAQKMPLDAFSWYLDLRRYGSVPHSGFGLGIERFVKYILNLDHIRDAIPFPRTINRLKP
jgi:asparaginyl-tRNA synthetase